MTENQEMSGNTQADFIKDELNFGDVDPNDPLTKASLEEATKDEWINILGNDQLRKKIVVEGENGTRPQKQDLCTISYVGKLEDGTIVENEEDVTIQIGDMELIQGLDLVITLMNKGEVSLVEIAPRFAYGSLGKEPDIPKDATLQYTVTLKDVQQEDEIEKMNFEQKKFFGNKKKERGNYWFKRNDYMIAIQCYRRAIDYLTLPEDSTITENWTNSNFQKLLDDRVIVYNNMAMAQIKAEAYDAALDSIENVLRCQPRNGKALFRKGKILHIKGEHEAAYNILQQSLKINPQDKQILHELEILKKKSEKDAQIEKNLYRKMLGTNASKKNSLKGKTDKMKKNSSKYAWTVIGGTVITAIGLLMYKMVS